MSGSQASNVTRILVVVLLAALIYVSMTKRPGHDTQVVCPVTSSSQENGLTVQPEPLQCPICPACPPPAAVTTVSTCENPLWDAAREEGRIFCSLEKFSIISDRTQYPMVHIKKHNFDIQVFANNDIVSEYLLKTNDWEDDDTELVVTTLQRLQKEYPNRNVTFMDIGGNIGWYPAVAAAHGFPVVVFEPTPLNQALIRSMVCHNKARGFHDRITLYTFGLGTFPNRCLGLVNNINIGNTYLECPDQSVTEATWEAWKENVLKTRVRPGHSFRSVVEIKTLDNVMAQPIHSRQWLAVLKMDCEGYEAYVMKGAPIWLSKHKPWYMMLEINSNHLKAMGQSPSEFLKVFTDLGYTIQIDGRGPAVSIDRVLQERPELGDLWLTLSDAERAKQQF